MPTRGAGVTSPPDSRDTPGFWRPGVRFMLLSALTVLNLLIGVLCEVVTETADVETAELAKTQATDQIGKVFRDIDVDG